MFLLFFFFLPFQVASVPINFQINQAVLFSPLTVSFILINLASFWHIIAFAILCACVFVCKKSLMSIFQNKQVMV